MGRTLVTTDSHVTVPYTLADELPDHYRAQVPHLEQRDDGLYFVRPLPAAFNKRTQMLMNAFGGGSAGIKVDPANLERMAQGNCLEAANPSTLPQGRLAEMARDGVAAEVLIGAGGFGTLGDIEVQKSWCRLSNDWLADTYRPYYDRFAPGISLPTDDMKASVDELEHAAGLGLRPILLPDAIWQKPYYDPYWAPLWEAAEALNIPVISHLGGARSLTAPWLPDDVSTAESERPSGGAGFSLICAGMAETLGWFVMGGVLERHPGLRLALTETFAGWLKWAMDLFDHQVRSGEAAAYGVKLKELPSHYIRRQVKATFMWDPTAVALRHEIGLDSLMWGNDYPHVEGIFLESQARVEQMFAGVPEAEVDRIVRGNACEFYHLDV